MAQVITSVAVTLLAVDVVLTWWWVWRYRTDDWRSTAHGRHAMRFTLAFAVTLTLTFMFMFVPVPLELGMGIAALMYALIGVEVVNQHRLLSAARLPLTDRRPLPAAGIPDGDRSGDDVSPPGR